MVFFSGDRLSSVNFLVMNSAPLSKSKPSVNSGKHLLSGTFLIFSRKRSVLLRNRMIEVSVNQRELQIESKSWSASCMRF